MKMHLPCEGSMPDPSGPGPLALVCMELSTASPLRCRHHASAAAAIAGLARGGAFGKLPLLPANALRTGAQRVIHERERTVMIA